MSNKTYSQRELAFARIKERNQLETQRLFSDGAHYWTADSLPFAYAMACVQVVILHGKAEKQYHKVVEAWALPDCQLAMQDFKAAYLDKAETLKGWPGLWNEPDKFTDSQNFEYLLDWVAEFIKEGFNREIDRGINESWKVLPSLETPLFMAVATWALADYLGIKLEDWNTYKPLVRNGKTYDTEDIMRNRPTHRVHREIASLFKRYGKLVHDKKLLDVAEKWYQSRVVYAGPEEYTRRYYIDKDIYYDPRNIGNEIKPCDYATGYPRRG
ncbi:MAG: hypothetical protein Q8O55_02365 [Dehalococcoidales bacterium]|nr:hypothetical protein [Dehalococcoidales bacterium]